MCLAIPARVVSLNASDMATVDIDGVRKEIYIGLVDDVAEGDYLIVHVGFALNKLDPDEAKETLDLLRQAAEMEGGLVTWPRAHEA